MLPQIVGRDTVERRAAECLEAERIKYAIRLPANQVLQNRVGYLLKRPVGRPPNEVRRYYANFTYRHRAARLPRQRVDQTRFPGIHLADQHDPQRRRRLASNRIARLRGLKLLIGQSEPAGIEVDSGSPHPEDEPRTDSARTVADLSSNIRLISRPAAVAGFHNRRTTRHKL